jgi:hypothetical protein
MQAYTVLDFHPAMADELVRHDAARSRLTWHFCPPAGDWLLTNVSFGPSSASAR